MDLASGGRGGASRARRWAASGGPTRGRPPGVGSGLRADSGGGISSMRTIDIHAHVVPSSLWRAVDAGREWFGFRHEPGEGLGSVVGGGQRTSFNSPKVRFTPEERLRDMDLQGVDVQVLSIHTPFF